MIKEIGSYYSSDRRTSTHVYAHVQMIKELLDLREGINECLHLNKTVIFFNVVTNKYNIAREN